MELKQDLRRSLSVVRLLLIVPYGIETYNQVAKHNHQNTFNCTLWN